jgi:hypothetical protein
MFLMSPSFSSFVAIVAAGWAADRLSWFGIAFPVGGSFAFRRETQALFCSGRQRPRKKVGGGELCCLRKDLRGPRAAIGLSPHSIRRRALDKYLVHMEAIIQAVK